MASNFLSCLNAINRVIFITVSIVVCSGTAGESSVAGTSGVSDIVGVTVIAIVHIVLLKIGGRSLEPAAIMCYAFDCQLSKLHWCELS
ncbi:hypothetical protein Tco_1029082 [Tanacetum coccineum]|uniref:Uncharacterized protein n=1 Tax=Tanacetum coccineum TaxID=301880 RepID=A0ABQ5G2F8_9ASTR